jgi:hypothetical protein
VAQAHTCSQQVLAQVAQLAAADIAQLDALEGVPDALIRVEIGRVARQLLQLQALGRPRAQEVLDRLPVMNRRAIPDEQQLPADLAQEHAQKADNRFTVVVVLTHLQEQAPIQRDGADDREVVVGEGHAQDGGLATWRPGTHGHRQQIEARFVYPDDGCSLFVRPFLSVGQRSSYQVAILAASRCVARVMGCW